MAVAERETATGDSTLAVNWLSGHDGLFETCRQSVIFGSDDAHARRVCVAFESGRTSE
jgi:hypothetical protein